MPKFNCSYAYDVPCYFDFAVEAENEEEAEKKIQAALENGEFLDTPGDPSWDDWNADSQRVFVSGQEKEDVFEGEAVLIDGKLYPQGRAA